MRALPWLIASLVAATLLVPGTVFAQSESHHYLDLLRAKRSSRDRVALARELARREPKALKKVLLPLLQSKDSKDRDAAIAGLFALKDPSVGGPLLDKMFDDFFSRREIRKGLIAAMSRYFPAVEKRYWKTKRSRDRRDLLDMVCASGVARGAALLRAIAGAPKKADRKLAFQRLAKHYPTATTRAFARGLVKDPDMGPTALAFLSAKSTRDDLPLFRAILDEKETKTRAQYERKVLALRGTLCGTDEASARTTLVQALQGNDPVMTRMALEAIRKPPASEVLARIVKLAGKSESQKTRLFAARALGAWGLKAALPVLISALGEPYRRPPGAPPQRTGFFFGSRPKIDWPLKWERKHYDEVRQVIGRSLESITRQKLGTAYESWVEWALLRGLAVDGRNLLQLLFSGYPSQREKALAAAARLLGHGSMATMRKKVPALATKTGVDLAIAVGERLVEKGLVKLEP